MKHDPRFVRLMLVLHDRATVARVRTGRIPSLLELFGQESLPPFFSTGATVSTTENTVASSQWLVGQKTGPTGVCFVGSLRGPQGHDWYFVDSTGRCFFGEGQVDPTAWIGSGGFNPLQLHLVNGPPWFESEMTLRVPDAVPLGKWRLIQLDTLQPFPTILWSITLPLTLIVLARWLLGAALMSAISATAVAICLAAGVASLRASYRRKVFLHRVWIAAVVVFQIAMLASVFHRPFMSAAMPTLDTAISAAGFALGGAWIYVSIHLRALVGVVPERVAPTPIYERPK